ncbi:MAG: lycopene cyclase family protein [Flavobacteriales bacterium]
MKYDYIITGAGCAGLSLLYRILQEKELKSKKILVLDRDKKQTNDRTWCYWEKEEGLFESIVTHKWKTLEFLSEKVTKQFELQEYEYKMIQGVDFYSYVLSFAEKFENVTFNYEKVTHISTENNVGKVETANKSYEADFVFNSTPIFNPELNIKNSLLQHFEGWNIKVKKPIFNPKIGTLMDFRISQQYGDTFMYVLPTSPTEALIEYTLFTKELLKKEAYGIEIEKYIKDYLDTENYEITHKESGVIPMSLAKFNRENSNNEKVINIGTAGGYTKASSGYTFQFIQTGTEKIIENLRKGINPNPEKSFREKMFHWYDKTLLDVMLTDKLSGKDVFEILFTKIEPEKILGFLGNETRFIDELHIMRSVPMIPFITSGIKQMK